MPQLFGYGSIINLDSASRSLGRTMVPGDFTAAALPGFARVWRVAAPVIVDSGGLARAVDALFLDVAPDPQERLGCNGVLIEVSEQELGVMDRREKQYDRRSVVVVAEGIEVVACAYLGKPDSFASGGVVLAGYLALLEQALQRFDHSFQERFWQTTRPFSGEVIEGSYVFADSGQSRAAGRA